jgi:hypothetical protein
MIANLAFMPKHLLEMADASETASKTVYTPVSIENNGSSGLNEE